MEKSADEILKEIKNIDGNVTGILIPILKDTIADYKKIVFNLILIIVFLVASITSISAYSIYKYNDFLSQFEHESTDTITQDLDTGEGGDIINPNINAAR